MRRLLGVLTLIVSMSLPCFAGHGQLGGGAYCECGTPGCEEDYPGECGANYRPMATHQTDAPTDATAELGIIIVALLFWLRLKA
jgi:hypothetical protein